MSPMTVLTSAPEYIWHGIIACIPFLTVVNGKTKINPAQIIQFLIIASLISMGTAYLTLAKLEVRFDNLESVIGEVKAEVREIRKDFYVPHLPGH